MTPAETRRAAILAQALEDMDRLEKDSERTKVNPVDGDRRAITIHSSDLCEAGGTQYAEVELDLKTGRLLMPLLRKLITTELEKLGVTL